MCVSCSFVAPLSHLFSSEERRKRCEKEGQKKSIRLSAWIQRLGGNAHSCHQKILPPVFLLLSHIFDSSSSPVLLPLFFLFALDSVCSGKVTSLLIFSGMCYSGIRHAADDKGGEEDQEEEIPCPSACSPLFLAGNRLSLPRTLSHARPLSSGAFPSLRFDC